jgi:hypothetical protein
MNCGDHRSPPRVFSIFVLASAVAIAAATLFQAVMVVAVNLPVDSAALDLSPLLGSYRGPQISQNWALFAPQPTADNIHAIVRGVTASGSHTGWYDASQFFIIAMRKNRFTPTRAVSEGLAHSVGIVKADPSHEPERSIVLRTCAMVLELYAPRTRIVAIQVELDSWEIPPFSEHPQSPRVIGAKQLKWAPLPNVTALQ